MQRNKIEESKEEFIFDISKERLYQNKKAIELNLVIDNKSEIARILNIGIATVHRYLSEGWKPFETKARYFSDFIRNKEWFYEI